MKEFKGRVAVVTGAASGIGRAMAERFASEGMKVVLADIEEEALASAEKEMVADGASVLAVRTDVSKADEVESLADEAVKAFGAVHLLCNNAGVAPPFGVAWERTLNDWKWVLGVNLWGVIHGIRFFEHRPKDRTPRALPARPGREKFLKRFTRFWTRCADPRVSATNPAARAGTRRRRWSQPCSQLQESDPNLQRTGC